MQAKTMLREVVQTHLMARVPEPYETPFQAHLFSVNLLRFATQNLVLLLMDTLSLLFYLYYYRRTGGLLPLHIAMHALRIAMDAILFRLMTYRTHAYDDSRFLCRKLSLLYPLLHLVTEFLLFALGPHDMAGLVRLLAVPFVIGGLTVLRQRRAILLEAIAYLLISLYLGLTRQYAGQVHLPLVIVNIWLVTFPCALLISFTVYSWFAGVFLANQRTKAATGEMRRLNSRLSVISMHDPLTGLLNRRGFQQALDPLWRAHAARDDTATMMMIDIDFFKAYNDTFGHLAGDECLVRVTRALSQALEGIRCHLARYGGEEFVVAAFDMPHDAMVSTASRLRAAVYSLGIENQRSIAAPYVTVSIGVASAAISQVHHADQLINMADECLYLAKQGGRDQVVHTQLGCERYGFRDVHGAPLSTKVLETLAEDQPMQEAFFNINVDSTFLYEPREHLFQFSPAVASAFGLPRTLENATYETVAALLPISGEEVARVREALAQAVKEHAPSVMLDVRLMHADGQDRTLSLRVHYLYDPGGNLLIAHGSLLRCDQILEYLRYVNKHTLTDMVTLLPNRQKLSLALSRILKEEGASGHLLFLDIESFREINGVGGHDYGDKVLAEVALRLSWIMGRHRPVYSFSVDQFVVIAAGTTDEEADQLMAQVHAYFDENALELGGRRLVIRFRSVSVAYRHGDALDALLVDLDIAMQLIKRERTRRQMRYTAEARAAFLRSFYLTKQLEASVAAGCRGFFLAYQPIVDVGRRCIGAEALLRWRNAEGEVIPPAEVVPLLEQSGLMPQVEGFIFASACADCAAFIREGAGERFFVNINLSPEFLCRPTLADELTRAAQASGLAMYNVTLEVPETAAILEMRAAIEILTDLRSRGFRVAVDDFGTGYSSLNYLGKLPIDEVKIDRSFVTEIEASQSANTFLGAVVNLAKSMDYLVCVEGVETSGQDTLIGATGADYLQGFYFSRPVEAETFIHSVIRAAGGLGP